MLLGMLALAVAAFVSVQLQFVITGSELDTFQSDRVSVLTVSIPY